MTTHHPSSFILKQFAYGDINDQLAAMVAAHIESCPLCSQEVQEYEKNLPNLEENFSTPDLSSIADSILSAPPQKSSAHSEEVLDTDFCIQNKVIDLPYSLRTLKKRMSPWKKSLGKLIYSKVDLDGPGHLYFLHFEKGAKTPTHSHHGQENLYVVAGSFHDGVSEYSTGDFASFTQQHTHTPQTEDPDGCLLLLSLEAPFHFQKGWSRLLNPIGHWLFKR